VIDPEVAIISTISYDHIDILGHTLTEIATEKSGIIKPGITVVSSPQPGEAAAVIEAVCLRHGAQLVRVGHEVTRQGRGFNFERQQLEVKGVRGRYEIDLSLLGEYQLDNAAAAIAALEVLAGAGFNISRENVVAGLAQVDWPGRFQILSRQPLVLVDGSHNPESARQLVQSLKQYFKPARAMLVIGLSADKDILGIVAALASSFDRVITTRAHHPRAMKAEAVAAAFAPYGIVTRVAPDVAVALPLALSLVEDGELICVTGSLFIVAEAIETANRLGLKW
jgi:dihydrofolate synthase/folylpolyglutamate synthase